MQTPNELVYDKPDLEDINQTVKDPVTLTQWWAALTAAPMS